MEDIYPHGPAETPSDLTRPTGAYKRHAWWAVASLMLFMVLYLALTGWFAWTAYRLLGQLVLGGTGTMANVILGASAAFLAVFMLKALFFVKRSAVPDSIEVKADEQPGLFKFLHRLADEAGAPRPKRVYLSPRVNASVFYDLSLLNLLFPSRKNLEIGLALVNVLTLSEMKAVLAHEFGHFAQRSMAVGSWVYIAQQIAAHIVAKRDALDKALEVLSRIDIRIAWIGWLLQLIVWSIRSLMDTLLRLVVLAQRALSRQMEFQADLVAVSLTGSDELVHALHKLQAADDSWGRTLNFTDSELRKGRIPHDLFAVQTRIIETVGGILDDESYGKVPAPASGEQPEARRVFKSSFAQPPQMWSTHPENSTREDNAKRRYLSGPHDERSAWLLFDDAATVKEKVVAHMLGKVEAKPASAEDTFRALDERYSLLQYQARYRGAYLGRPLAIHAANPSELYGAGLFENTLNKTEVKNALNALYPEQLGHDLTQLRDLGEERATLEAVRDKVYRADGGRIVHRGREIARKELPAAIREVTEEEEQVRQRIIEHDRRCRTAHLAAAEQLGGGWKAYLVGLINALHYAEHSLADVRDAQGLLNNVLAVVTAGGKVSRSEMRRLLSAANELQRVLAGIYAYRDNIQLDQRLCERLEVSKWADMLEEFKLGQATKENINNWLKVVEGWIEVAAGALFALGHATLEQLLLTEDEVARHVRDGTVPDAAPSASVIPDKYATLQPGKERKLQRRLGLWDRFQTADGLLPATGRLLVAAAIVGTVLGFGMLTGNSQPVSIYNGLNRTVDVRIGDKQLVLAPFSAGQVEVGMAKSVRVAAYVDNVTVIERFTAHLASFGGHYVYNVAGASPMVKWYAVYGSASKIPARMLGAQRWFRATADVFFKEPPRRVQSSNGGASRAVLTGLGNRAPAQQLKLLRSEAERRRVIQTHLKWDNINAKNAKLWRAAANGN